jgi:hypothetical protein
MYEKITQDNWIMFAIKHYNNPECEGEKEFYDDLKKFKYIKRLLRKYYETGKLKKTLLLNHITLLINVFGGEVAATLLLFKIDKKYWGALKAFMLFLNILRPDELNNIETDEVLLRELNEI